jgi:uncharacterized protein YeaO (DUF488 family)
MPSEPAMVKLKRIYATPDSMDGYRVLVDRLWPRGVSKEKAHIELWMKEIGPSDRLRKWFGHDPKRWVEFQKRYREELRTKTGLIDELRQLERKHRTLTLTYGARDEEHNQAVVLSSVLKESE